jgi:hypothetical protein
MSLNLRKQINDVELSTWNFEDAMAWMDSFDYAVAA